MVNSKFGLRLLEILYVCIICVLICLTILFICCTFRLLNPDFSNVSISDYANSITAITAVFAFVWAIKEYDLHKEALKAKVLSEYNKRYSEDPNIVKVVKYLQDYKNIDSYICPKLTKHEVQMFMRFFEELEIQIIHRRIDEEDVFELFTYYASILNKNSEIIIFLGIKYNNVYWSNYKNLVDRYDKYIKKNKSITTVS